MIKLIKSTFYNEKSTKTKLNKFISSAKMLSFGDECKRFEEKFSNYQGRKETVFVNSGSSANLAIIQALLNMGMLNEGDKVGFSAVTWSTNVMPLIQLNLIPIPVDIEVDTLNISSKKLIEVLKKHKIKLLFITNLLGFCDDIDEIATLCKKTNILLIEDNCEALGSIYHGRKLGNYGFASTFSFYVGHHMSTIEGGAVCTDDDELATMLRVVRAHGWDRNLTESKQIKIRSKYNVNSSFYSRYTFYDLGYNLRPTEISGFLGNIQLDFIEEIVTKRNNIFLRLIKQIKENPAYFKLKYEHIDLVSNFAIPIVCKSKAKRDELVERCADLVEIRPIVGGDMTEQPFFKKYSKVDLDIDTTNSKLVHQQGLYFGNNPDLTEKEISILTNTFK